MMAASYVIDYYQPAIIRSFPDYSNTTTLTTTQLVDLAIVRYVSSLFKEDVVHTWGMLQRSMLR